MHGGAVRAESAGEGCGATFTVKLPQTLVNDRGSSTPEGDKERRQTTTPRNELYGRPSLDGMRVLAVDDEQDTRDLLTVALERCGADVMAAGSASEALAVLSEQRPDVLVSDIGMPGEDGYSLIRRVRELPAEKGGRIPALALTAYARAEDRLRALSSGYQAHVAKPVDPAELVITVARLGRRVTH